MENKYTRLRLLALLCAFIFVFSLVLSGCSSVKKITKPDGNTNKNDIINIGDGYGDIPDDWQIVVGSDGQSYLVDGEGNSVVYNPTSAYFTTTTPIKAPINNPDTPTPDVTPDLPIKPEPTPEPTPEPESEPSSTTTKLNVYNALAIQRRFGFNKAYDNLAGLANFYLDTIRVYFTYNGRDWLIELWKGEYAMASVGCEIGYYYNDRPSSDENGRLDWSVAEKKHFKAVGDEDAMYTSMELWQYVKSTDAEPVKRINFGRRLCWWAADFENAVLENHRDRTALVMRGSIEFPTNEMRDLFIEGLEERGFKEGSTSSYNTTERYEVDGKKVIVMWRYFDEDKFQEAQEVQAN